MSLQMKSFEQLIQLTRASTATYVDVDGTIKTAAVDQPRFDWSTGRRALLLEGSTTNFATRSSHTAGYPWNTTTTNNGIAATMVASGTLNGVPYADYALTGTATATTSEPFVASSYSRTAASIGQTWTSSLYHQLVSGSWPSSVVIDTGVIQENSSNSYLAGTFTGSAPTASIGRTVATATLSAGALAYVRGNIDLRGLTAGVTTFTGQVIRLFGWQLEQGASATSLIQSLSGVAVTRAADVVAPIPLTGLSAGYTLVVEGQLDAVAGSFDRVVQLDTGSNSNRHLMIWDATQSKFVQQAFAADILQGAEGVSGGPQLGQAFKLAFAVGPNYFQASRNGVAGAVDNTVTYVAPTVLRLAQTLSGAKPARLLLSRVAIYPVKLTETQLIEVTA